jgi:ribosomal-protein-serine acetyltransferase
MNPLLLNFPDSFDTERLTIRAPRIEDAPQIVEAVNESLAELRPWMPWAAQPTTLEFQQARLRRVMSNWIIREDLGMQLCLKGTDTMVGGSGLHRMNWQAGNFEIGYWCRTKFVGQGYISEAVNGITDFAFKHLKANRVSIYCDADNDRSSAVAKRCGFLLEGILRNDSLDVDGNLRSTLVFSKISPKEFNYYDGEDNH